MVQDTGKIEIITTLFPIYDFARQIGKERVNVSLLLPPGVEAHTFEPKPADVVRISKVDIFIYTGKFMEPWAEGLLKGVSNKKLVVVDASQGIKLISEEGEYRKGKDPHIWLDLRNDQIMVDTIARAFANKDPANSVFYFKNAEDYKVRLVDLDSRFKETLATCKHKTIIYGGHFAFGYFTKRYGLKHESPYEGFAPNAEPSPKAIARLINRLKESGIKYIYCEELLDPKVSRVISQATGAKLELLHGAHNISKNELNRRVTFIDIMEDNLKRLKIGLECK